MMKKFLATTLAIALTMGMSLTAFAAENNNGIISNPDGSVEKPDNVPKLTVVYQLENEFGISPEETFSFENVTCTGVENAATGVTEANAPKPHLSVAKYDLGDATLEGTPVTIDVEWDKEFTSVGIYRYTFNLKAGNTAGVVYHSDQIELVATVQQDTDGFYTVVAIHTENEGGEKFNEFTNTYQAGHLEVIKQVTGNMGDTTRDFAATVTFTAPEGKAVKAPITYTVGGDVDNSQVVTFEEGQAEVPVTLHNDVTIKFDNIPYGVEYEVVESDYTAEGYDTTYVNGSGTINSELVVAEVTNKKGTDVDTGIITDNMPYVVLLAIAFVGMVVFFMKKRSAVR